MCKWHRNIPIIKVITHWEKLLDSDWLRHCEFICNVRANSVIRGKLQISRAKSVIHSKCKYKQELRINPILDEGGQICPPAGFLNIAQKPLGLGS